MVTAVLAQVHRLIRLSSTRFRVFHPATEKARNSLTNPFLLSGLHDVTPCCSAAPTIGGNESHTLTGLKPGTTYTIDMAAILPDGTKSRYSPRITVTTD